MSFANDFEEVCIQTYRYNHPEVPASKILNADIRSIVDHIEDYVTEDIDVVVGGPPCQGFSSANKQRIIDDPRNELYKYYIRAIKKFFQNSLLWKMSMGCYPLQTKLLKIMNLFLG